MTIDRYDIRKSYEWNYERGPRIESVESDEPVGEYDFCGIPVGSPLGVAAGPLLHGGWICHYARRGFDVLTYKTVRTRFRECYGLPNLQPVDAGNLAHRSVVASDEMDGSWAVSFGMPSKSVETWEQDVAVTRRSLPPTKLLSVSVVATAEPNWPIEDVAGDYADCARRAVDAGADAIELNFSCPNVSTCDGQLYQDPVDAATVAKVARQRIGDTPLLIKIGLVPSASDADRLVDALSPLVDALVMVNGIASRVSLHGRLLFDGQSRGICGAAIRDESARQVERFAESIRKSGSRLRIVGVGGIMSATDVKTFLSSGAHSVQLATAIMLDPDIGIAIRRSL